MNSKRFESSSAVLRYFAGVLAIVAFALIFGTVLYSSGHDIQYGELFFNTLEYNNGPHFYGFIAQLLTLFAGVFGVLIIVIEPLYENSKTNGLIAGGVLALCGIIILLLKVFYCASECAMPEAWSSFHLHGTTIAAGILAIVAGGMNICASLFVKD